MKKVFLLVLLCLAAGTLYSQSSVAATATVTILPAVGASAIVETSRAAPAFVAAGVVPSPAYLRFLPKKEEAALCFRVVSNAAVYSVNVLAPFPQNFVQQKTAGKAPLMTLSGGAGSGDLYSVSLNSATGVKQIVALPPVIPEIVVHFN